MKKNKIIPLLITFTIISITNSYSQNDYKNTLDSLAYYLKFVELKISINRTEDTKKGLKLCTKYNQQGVYDAINELTYSFKSLTQNKKNKIIICSNLWMTILDLKYIYSIEKLSNAVVLKDSTDSICANVYHRIWKGFIHPKEIQLVLIDSTEKKHLEKLYFYCKRAVELMK